MHRTFRLFILILFYSLGQITIQAQTKRIVHDSIYSEVLGKYVEYSILLPKEYDKNETNHFPALYLLHGFNGNCTNWTKKDKIDSIIDSLRSTGTISPSIIVMPNGDNSYFINNFDGSYNFEDFFIKEFLPAVEKNFRISTERNANAICGISMGGFGALTMVTKHPEKFSTCIAISAAIRPPDIFAGLSQKKYDLMFSNVYGKDLKGQNRITEHWKANNPYFIVDNNFLNNTLPTNIYIDCGMQDYLFKSNQRFHQHLLKLNISHEYHMRIGAHQWIYWKQGLINGLIYWENVRD